MSDLPQMALEPGPAGSRQTWVPSHWALPHEISCAPGPALEAVFNSAFSLDSHIFRGLAPPHPVPCVSLVQLQALTIFLDCQPSRSGYAHPPCDHAYPPCDHARPGSLKQKSDPVSPLFQGLPMLQVALREESAFPNRLSRYTRT